MLENLKKLRSEAGISQKQLAEAVGVSQQSINKYENHNIEPDISTMILIADYFKTSVDYLVGNTDIQRKIEKVFPYELSDEEANIILGYRKLNKSEKQSISLVIENYNKNSR